MLTSQGQVAVREARQSDVTQTEQTWSDLTSGMYQVRNHVIFPPFPDHVTDDIVTVQLPRRFTNLTQDKIGVLVSVVGDCDVNKRKIC